MDKEARRIKRNEAGKRRNDFVVGNMVNFHGCEIADTFEIRGSLRVWHGILQCACPPLLRWHKQHNTFFLHALLVILVPGITCLKFPKNFRFSYGHFSQMQCNRKTSINLMIQSSLNFRRSLKFLTGKASVFQKTISRRPSEKNNETADIVDCGGGRSWQTVQCRSSVGVIT